MDSFNEYLNTSVIKEDISDDSVSGCSRDEYIKRVAREDKERSSEELTEEDASPANNTCDVDMNPTGLPCNDKRRKYQCDNMFRRANGLDIIQKMIKARQAQAETDS